MDFYNWLHLTRERRILVLWAKPFVLGMGSPGATSEWALELPWLQEHVQGSPLQGHSYPATLVPPCSHRSCRGSQPQQGSRHQELSWGQDSLHLPSWVPENGPGMFSLSPVNQRLLSFSRLIRNSTHEWKCLQLAVQCNWRCVWYSVEEVNHSYLFLVSKWQDEKGGAEGAVSKAGRSCSFWQSRRCSCRWRKTPARPCALP